MEKGIDFLKSQVNNAVMQHKAFLEALEDHEQQAEDGRFRDLCSRHIPRVREHQRMLEEYQNALGAEEARGRRSSAQCSEKRVIWQTLRARATSFASLVT